MAFNLGLEALNKAIADSLPQGVMILVKGSPGTGTELFAKQFSGAAGSEEKLLYISTSERKDGVVATMKSFGWTSEIEVLDIAADYYEDVLAKELEISRYRYEGIGINDVKNFTAERKVRRVNYLTKVLYGMSKLKPPFRIVIDSLDFFFEHYESESVISMLRTMRAHAKQYKSVVLGTMMTDAYQVALTKKVENISDCIIELNKKEVGTGFEHYMQLAKVINHPEKSLTIKYSIKENGISAGP
jgi:KaiC/GvpD/RAD55 family RecA-like ATPase